MFNNEDNYSIFDCLYQIDDISKKYIDSIGNNVNILIYLIRLNKNNLKVSAALNLLHDINKIGQQELVNDLVEFLRDTNNNKKIEEMYDLISIIIDNPTAKKCGCGVTILEYIKKYINNENYDKYLSIIIKKFIKNDTINNVDCWSAINYILSIILNNYNNENIELIIQFLDDITISKDNKDYVFIVLEDIIKINFINDEHKKLYLKVLKDIFSSDIDDKVIKYLIDKVNDINSTKTLQLLIDIYPLIIKYSCTSEEYVVNELINFDKLENMPCKGKKKKLILPINYEEE